MKKLLPVILLLCLATAAFGLEFSAGAGATVGGFWQTEYYEDYVVIYDERKIMDATVAVSFSAWFDAMYGMASIGFRANGLTHRTITNVGPFAPAGSESDTDERWGYLSFSLLGRYPFALGPVRLFPLLGIEYDLNLYHKDSDGTDLKASLTDEEKGYLNQFWFKFGVGADITLSKRLYVRPLALIGFKFLNAAEKQVIQDAIDTGGASVARKTDLVFAGGVQVGWRF
jgi:hypothetical protein